MGILAVVLIASILAALFFLGFAIYSALLLIIAPPLAALATAVVFLAVALQAGYLLQNKILVMKHQVKQRLDHTMSSVSPTGSAATMLAGLLPNLALGLLARRPILGLGLGAIALLLVSKGRHKG